MSNSLDPDQIHRFAVTDMGPNCFQMISVDGKAVTNRKRVNQDSLLNEPRAITLLLCARNALELLSLNSCQEEVIRIISI